MTSLLKSFGKGLLYLLVLPLLLVLLALFAVYGIFMFFFVGIQGIYLYFTGRNIFGELPEDIKAREILEVNSNSSSKEDNSEEDKTTNSTPTSYTTYFGPIDHPLDEQNKESIKIEEIKEGENNNE